MHMAASTEQLLWTVKVPCVKGLVPVLKVCFQASTVTRLITVVMSPTP